MSIESRTPQSIATPGVVRRQRVTLTSAQILALFTTPVTLVAAPGAGKYISVDEIFARVNYGSAAYVSANALEFRYTDGAGVKVSGDLAAGFVQANSNRADKAVGVAAAQAVANAPLVVAVPSANPTTGDSTFTLDILYRIVSF